MPGRGPTRIAVLDPGTGHASDLSARFAARCHGPLLSRTRAARRACSPSASPCRPEPDQRRPAPDRRPAPTRRRTTARSPQAPALAVEPDRCPRRRIASSPSSATRWRHRRPTQHPSDWRHLPRDRGDGRGRYRDYAEWSDHVTYGRGRLATLLTIVLSTTLARCVDDDDDEAVSNLDVEGTWEVTGLSAPVETPEAQHERSPDIFALQFLDREVNERGGRQRRRPDLRSPAAVHRDRALDQHRGYDRACRFRPPPGQLQGARRGKRVIPFAAAPYPSQLRYRGATTDAPDGLRPASRASAE